MAFMNLAASYLLVAIFASSLLIDLIDLIDF